MNSKLMNNRDLFIGRTNLINKINDKENKKIIILHGIPGVGKTSIANEFMYRKIEDETFKKAYWFAADDKDKIIGQLYDYGTQIEGHHHSIGRQETIKNFIKSIQDSKDILLVFDNVEALIDVKNAIDIDWINCKTIITTRNLLVNSVNATKLDVPAFNSDETREYIQNRLSQLNESDLETIFDKIGSQDMVPYYLVMITSSLINNPNPQNITNILESGNEYMENLLKSLRNKCEEIVDLLKYVMLIDPDNIPGKLIEKILLNKDFKKAVKILRDECLCRIINPNSKNYGISIHRLLQADLKKNLDFKNKESEITSDLLRMLEEEFPETKYIPDESWKIADLYYRHIKRLENMIPNQSNSLISKLYYKLSLYKANVLRNYTDGLFDGQKALEYAMKDGLNDENLAKIYTCIGSIYSLSSHENKAIENYNLAEELYKNIFKNDHSELATLYNNIGKSYSILGKDKDAFQYKLMSLEMKQRLYKEEDHYDLTASYDSIAGSYLKDNNHVKALEYYQLSLKMRERIFKEDNYYISVSHNVIGLVYYILGEQKKALEHYILALRIRKNIFKNNDNPEIAVSYNNIGCCYSALKNENKAIEFKFKSLEMRERIYEGDHVRKAVSYHDVGRTFSYLGNETNALDYYMRSLNMKKKLFKDDSFDFVLIYKDIGTSYSILGDMNKSIEHFQIALNMIQRLDKDELVHKAAVNYEMGQMYSCFGDDMKALVCYMNAFDMQNKFFNNSDNRNIVLSLNAISLSYAIKGEQLKALEYYNQSIEMYNRLLNNEENLEKAVFINDLGLIYYYTGKQEEAIEYFKQSIEIIQKLSEEKDKNHPDIANAYNNIALAYSKLDNEEKALEYFELFLNMRKVLYNNESSSHLAHAYNNVGKSNFKLGKSKEALEFFMFALKINEKIYQNDHPEVADVYENMSVAFSNLGDDILASKYQKMCNEMKFRIFGASNKFYFRASNYKKASEYFMI